MAKQSCVLRFDSSDDAKQFAKWRRFCKLELSRYEKRGDLQPSARPHQIQDWINTLQAVTRAKFI